MPEIDYGVVEMVFSFGSLIVFCVWQLWSTEKTRKKLQQDRSYKNEQR